MQHTIEIILNYLKGAPFLLFLLKGTIFSVGMAIIALWGRGILNNQPLTILTALANCACSIFVSVIVLVILYTCKAVTLMLIVTPICAFLAEPILTYINVHRGKVLMAMWTKGRAIIAILNGKGGQEI